MRKQLTSCYRDSISDFRERILAYVENVLKYVQHRISATVEGVAIPSEILCRYCDGQVVEYLIREFLVSKLDEYTIRHDGKKDYRVRRTGHSVSETSYDCISDIHNDIRALVNVKVCKSGGANNAVAAIQQLYKDYVETEPKVEKCFLVLKVHYGFCHSIRNASQGERAISIEKVEAFFLDEVDLSKEHLQDHRSWSGKSKNPNAGRLQVSDAFLASHIVPAPNISYGNTVKMLKAVVKRNG